MSETASDELERILSVLLALSQIPDAQCALFRNGMQNILRQHQDARRDERITAKSVELQRSLLLFRDEVPSSVQSTARSTALLPKDDTTSNRTSAATARSLSLTEEAFRASRRTAATLS